MGRAGRMRRTTDRLTQEGWDVFDGAFEALRKRIGTYEQFEKETGINYTLLSHWKKHMRLPTIPQARIINKRYHRAEKSLRPDLDWTYIR